MWPAILLIEYQAAGTPRTVAAVIGTPYSSPSSPTNAFFSQRSSGLENVAAFGPVDRFLDMLFPIRQPTNPAVQPQQRDIH